MLITWFTTASDPQQQLPSKATQRIKCSLDFMSARGSDFVGEMNQDTTSE